MDKMADPKVGGSTVILKTQLLIPQMGTLDSLKNEHFIQFNLMGFLGVPLVSTECELSLGTITTAWCLP